MSALDEESKVLFYVKIHIQLSGDVNESRSRRVSK